jgi:hypothetical protein
VTEAQDVVLHAFVPSILVGVVSICAKFIPATVTLVVPEVAALSWCACETTGVSNVNEVTALPMVVSMVRATSLVTPVPPAEWHVAAVSVTHTEVKQTVEPIRISGVASCATKLRPITVSSAMPDDGAFGREVCETVGAS